MQSPSFAPIIENLKPVLSDVEIQNRKWAGAFAVFTLVRAELSDFGAQDPRLNDELGEEELGSYGQELYDLCRHVGHGPVA